MAPASTAHGQNTTQPVSALSIPTASLIQPEELNVLLQKPQTAKPLVLQVGSRIMYDESHIAGAEYAGPGSRDEGAKALKDRVSSLSRDTFIVIYCGCCPWNHCPNVGPAFKLLGDMGFVHVKVLYIADNFGANWVDMGFPVASAH